MNFPKKYDHLIEDQIYKKREESGNFLPKKAKSKNEKTKKFVIPMPPPNVTGILHIGHAQNQTIQDILTRYHRMIGDETIWIPGTDHAGIATQVVVEKNLKKEKNLSRYDIGREKFLQETRDRAKKSRNTIVSQVKKIGSSCDRSREQFTMSEQLSRSVRKSFSNLFSSGKIYQWDYITNRSVGCQTVLSDIEIDYVENEGKLYYINYFIEGKGDAITIATTRPETLFADVAIAVNPYDKRYKKHIGKNVLIPIINRPIPIVADELVDMQFWTGALKITPTHDPLDFEIAKKHNLPMNIFAFDKNANFTEHAGPDFVGKNIDQFFQNVIDMITEIGNLVKVEPHHNTIPICSRSQTRVQPMLSKQRFVDVKDAAAKALNLIDNEETKVYPSRFNETFHHWLGNIKPRCISRQLWRWHRIPVWQGSKNTINVFDEDVIIEKYQQELKKSSKGKNLVLSLMIFNLIADSRLPNPFNIESFVDLIFADSITPHLGTVGTVYLNIYKGKFSDDKVLLAQVLELEKIFIAVDKNTKSLIAEAGKIVDELEKSFWLRKTGDLYEFDFDSFSPHGDEDLKQDEDVFDTWFSSALWPFSITGRPEKTSDFEDYFPNSVVVTGYDIIFFWIARMMMMSLENTGEKPFEAVYFNGLVRDEKGQKMSKSKWNGIDPIEMVEKYGADSLRLSLIVGTTPGNDLSYSVSKAEYYHRFLNKLRNASRFVITKIVGEDQEAHFDLNLVAKDIEKNLSKLNDFDLWMVDQVNELTKISWDSFKKFHLGEFAHSIVQTVWHSFCDWYIEITKIQKSDYTDKVMIYSLGTMLKILHPYTPFITEKLWNLVWFEGMLIAQERPSEIASAEKNYKINLLMNSISELRNLRSKSDTKPHEKAEIIIQANTETTKFFQKYTDLIATIVNASSVLFMLEDEEIPADFDVQVIVNIKVGLKGVKIIDNKTKLAQLEKQLQDEQMFLQDLRMIISNSSFLSNAPKDLVETKKKKMEEVKQKIDKISLEISKLKMQMK